VHTPGGVVEDTVPDDQSVVVNTAGGLVVITGCGHAGIVNILTAADTQFGHRPVYAIIGGLHLFAAKDEQVDWTADQLKRFGVRYLMGAHCTGIESLYRLRSGIGLSRQTAVVGAVAPASRWAKGFTRGASRSRRAAILSGAQPVLRPVWQKEGLRALVHSDAGQVPLFIGTSPSGLQGEQRRWERPVRCCLRRRGQPEIFPYLPANRSLADAWAIN